MRSARRLRSSRRTRPRRAGGGGLARLAALLLLAGCAAHRGAAVRDEPGLAPAEIRERLIARASAAVLFDGSLRLSGRHGNARLRARAVAVAEAGGRLYLESVGTPGFVIASDGQELRVLLAEERAWLRAPASAATVEALVGLPLTPEELGALLAGVGAPGAALAAGSLDGARLRVANGELVLGGDGVQRGTLRELRFEAGPARDELRLEVASRRLELRLRLSPEPAPGGAPRALDFFRPEPPHGFKLLWLEDLEQPVLLPEAEPR